MAVSVRSAPARHLGSTTVAPAASAPPVTTDEFELPDAETVLKWGGVALVVLAIGFALSTAISRGWIGPGLQLAGALTLSTAMITGGIRLRSTRPAWTHALCVGGIGGLFTTFASDLFLDQAPDSLAFASIAVVGIGGAVTSRATRSEWTAGAALVGSTVAWFVVGEGVGPFGAATAWVAVAVAGALYLAVHHRWTALHLLAQLVGTVVGLFLADAASTTAETSAVLVVAGLLFASFAGPGTRADAAAGPTVWQQIEVQVVTLAPPWALAVIAGALGVDGDRRVGVTALLVAVGSLTVAAAVRSRVPAARTISLVVGASVACSIGFALLLAAAVAFVAIAVQAAGLVALTRVAGDDPKIRVNAAVLGAISLAFVVGRTTDAWVDDAAIGDDLAHLGIVAALAVGCWWLQRRTARLV
ncbi:MAG: putative rane protein, partial [Actinomycetota bacterium]